MTGYKYTEFALNRGDSMLGPFSTRQEAASALIKLVNEGETVLPTLQQRTKTVYESKWVSSDWDE